MIVIDLIKELQAFPELATVFIQRYCPHEGMHDGEIHRLDSVHEIWVRTVDGNGIHGPYIARLRRMLRIMVSCFMGSL